MLGDKLLLLLHKMVLSGVRHLVMSGQMMLIHGGRMLRHHGPHLGLMERRMGRR